MNRVSTVHALEFAEFLLRQYDLDKSWRVKFENLRSRCTLGNCNPVLKIILIDLQWFRIRPWSYSKRTILHEVAHALEPYRPYHGKGWEVRFDQLLKENT